MDHTPILSHAHIAPATKEVAHSNYGMVGLMKSSESKYTSEVFKQWRVELKSKGDSDRDIVRFHSDDDPSFKRGVQQ